MSKSIALCLSLLYSLVWLIKGDICQASDRNDRQLIRRTSHLHDSNLDNRENPEASDSLPLSHTQEEQAKNEGIKANFTPLSAISKFFYDTLGWSSSSKEKIDQVEEITTLEYADLAYKRACEDFKLTGVKYSREKMEQRALERLKAISADQDIIRFYKAMILSFNLSEDAVKLYYEWACRKLEEEKQENN